MTLGELRKIIEGQPDTLVIEIGVLTDDAEINAEPTRVFVGINVFCHDSLCINCDARGDKASITPRSQKPTIVVKDCEFISNQLGVWTDKDTWGG